MTPEEMRKKIEGLRAKLRWTKLPPHLADKYKAEIESLERKLKPASN